MNIILCRVLSIVVFLSFVFSSMSCKKEYVIAIPEPVYFYDSTTWVFIMAGQSNMAGRGLIAPQDSNTDVRLLSINSKSEIILAKEPIHYYEPQAQGLDCGLSFGQNILANAPTGTKVLILPTAVGGANISQWIQDEYHRGVLLLSNFKSKVRIAQQAGVLKGVLWHQGETDAFNRDTLHYKAKLGQLFNQFRSIANDATLPILIGELGSFAKNQKSWDAINASINNYALSDSNVKVIGTSDLEHKGDFVHFNAAAQRTLGKRFALEYLNW